MNRQERRAAAAGAQKEPWCPDAKTPGRPEGLGCPRCRKFEVRTHPMTCVEHGEHYDLICCFCGTHFFSFEEIEHAHDPSCPANEVFGLGKPS